MRTFVARVLAGLLPVCGVAGQQLDPPFTIRSSSTIGTTVCDVAYDVTRDIYAVVYRGNDGYIRVQRFRRSGARIGGALTVGHGFAARIADINLRNRFVVLWQTSGVVFARIVDPASGAVSRTVTLTSSATTVGGRGFDVASNGSIISDDVIVVWGRSRDVIGIELQVTASFQLRIGNAVTIDSASTAVTDVHISRGGGPIDRHLVAWGEANQTNIRGAIVTGTLQVLDTSIRIDSSGAERRFVDGIDGDGENFVVAYTKRESTSGSLSHVFARAVTFDPTSPTSTVAKPERVIEADPNDQEFGPTVAFTGSSSLVSYADQTGGESDFYAKSVEPYSCHLCEPQFGLDSNNGGTGPICSSVADRAVGGRSEGALVVWITFRTISGRGVATIRGRYYAAEDGAVRFQGGGCGAGGSTIAACARRGFGHFRVRNVDTQSGTRFLVLSPIRIDMDCGPCRLVPDPLLGVVVAVRGTSVVMPLPNDAGLVGAKFYAQWILVRSGAPCASFPGHFSDAVEVEIQ